MDTEDVRDVLNISVFDYNYAFLKRFFQEGKRHLTARGKLILGSSNIARLRLIKKLAENEDYECSMLVKTIVPAYKNRKNPMDLRIYSFKPKNRIPKF
jgi:hypothetical protein